MNDLKVGQRIWVRASKILGSKRSKATVKAVIHDLITKERLYLVMCDDETGEPGTVVDHRGVVCIGPPHSTAEFTRAP